MIEHDPHNGWASSHWHASDRTRPDYVISLASYCEQFPLLQGSLNLRHCSSLFWIMKVSIPAATGEFESSRYKFDAETCRSSFPLLQGSFYAICQ